jgi:hypothetical protein
MELSDWAKLQEELLKAQLSVVRGYLRSEGGEHKGKQGRSQSTSQISIITDILSVAGEPLHVSEIIRRAAKQYGVALDRESMVSAMSKKVKKGVTFMRTGPNIFGLKGT